MGITVLARFRNISISEWESKREMTASYCVQAKMSLLNNMMLLLSRIMIKSGKALENMDIYINHNSLLLPSMSEIRNMMWQQQNWSDHVADNIRSRRMDFRKEHSNRGIEKKNILAVTDNKITIIFLFNKIYNFSWLKLKNSTLFVLHISSL